MNPGDTVSEASRPRLDEATGFGPAASPGNTTLAHPPRTHETVQDIQDIIDKLAAVTRQLRRPGVSGRTVSEVPGPGGSGETAQ